MYQPYQGSQQPGGYPAHQPAPSPYGQNNTQYPGQQYGQVSPQQQQPLGQQYQQSAAPPPLQHPGMPPSDRESYQTVLPPNVTPGWNDPPSVLPTGHQPNRLTAMRRRPVDPSISGSGPSPMGYGAAPSAQSAPGHNPAAPYGSQYSQQGQHGQQHQYQAYGDAGQVQGQYAAGNAPYQQGYQQQQQYGM